MPSTMVSFHSICEVRSLGHDQVGTRELPAPLVDHDQLAQLFMLVVQREDPSVFLDGVSTLLVTHCILLSGPGRELRAIVSGVAFLLAEETLQLDVSDVPSFGLSLLFALPFSLPFVNASTSIGVESFPSAMLHCLCA